MEKNIWGAAMLNRWMFLIIVFFSFEVFAQGPGWVGPVTVTKIAATANGGFNVRVSPDVTGCLSQSGYGGSYISVYPDHPGIKIMLANVMAAFMLEKPISLYLSDTNCTSTEAVLGGF